MARRGTYRFRDIARALLGRIRGNDGPTMETLYQPRQGANRTEHCSEGEIGGFFDGGGSRSGNHHHRAAAGATEELVVGSWVKALHYSFMYEVESPGLSFPEGREIHGFFRDGKMRHQTQSTEAKQCSDMGLFPSPKELFWKGFFMDRAVVTSPGRLLHTD
jgi:hypothetical protein